jgi:hypothetical protein
MRVSSRQVSETVFELLVAVLLKIQIIWDWMLCWTTPHSRRPESSVNNAVSCREGKINVHCFHLNLSCIVVHVCVCLIIKHLSARLEVLIGVF